MTVRSTRLAAFNGASNTWTTAFTCPAGWRAIVKNISVENFGGPSSQLAVLIQSHSPSFNFNVFNQTVAASTLTSWNGWLVMNPGDLISVNMVSSTYDCWISGTLLQLTGTEPM